MDAALLLARLLLAAIFGIAALTKLADLAGSTKSVTEFGVPQAFAVPVGILLPLAELVTAALLVPVASAWWGALSALSLLLAFTAVISVNLARGRTPDCHCFGQLHAEPASWRTLARNGALAALAGFVVWRGAGNAGPSAVAWLGHLTAWQAVGVSTGALVAAVITVQAWFLLQLFQQHGRLLLRMDVLENTLTDAGMMPARIHHPEIPVHGLPVGAPAPAFQLPDLSGEAITLDALRARGTPIVLVFVDPGCGPCMALVPDLARWQHEHVASITLALISRGTPDENRAKLVDQGELRVLLQENYEIAETYQAHGTPGAVLIRPDGTVGSPMAMGAESIRHLVIGAIEERRRLSGSLPSSDALNGRPVAIPPSGLTFGAPAPAIKLPDLSGKMVALEEFRGRSTVLLFWHPGCGFCAQMLPHLRGWDADPPVEAPRLVLISGGTVEANKAIGLHSLVLLDDSFAAGRTFGASGTPSALLLDAHGTIASTIAVGAEKVLGLLHVR
jgi:peroxiredoxin